MGPSWPLLGPIWSQNGPQNGPKSGPKSAQKLVQKNRPKNNAKNAGFGPQNAPKLRSKISTLSDGSLLGHPSGARWPQEGARWPQEGVWRGLGGSQTPLQTPSKPPPNPLQNPQMPPSCPKMVPRWSRNGQRLNKMVPRCPQMSQDAPKMLEPPLPRRLHMAPKGVLPPF